ncbi:MAG: histidine phosphatase family protein [Alphaproteobacteria bacterium]|nr:histidine phosphatase family protein [Alphaproteobacteria bacterium]
MSVIWWVRHGPTHARGFVGHTDIAADLTNLDTLDRLTKTLPNNALLVSSDLIRASSTADAIQSARTRLAHEPSLREMDFGDWETKTFAEISLSDPELSRAFWTDPDRAAPPGGERWNDLSGRVTKAIDRLIFEHPNRDIIAVAHLAVILTQLQRATQISTKSAMSFTIDNLSITKLEPLTTGWRVLCVNNIP